MSKLLGSIGLGGMATFALFVFMASLIKGQGSMQAKPKAYVPVTINQTPEDSSAEKIKRALPLPPIVEKLVRAKPQQAEISDEAIIPQNPDFGVDIKRNTGDSFNRPLVQDSQARPIVRVEPRYPIKAAKNGIEGWVQLLFDINELGEVVNVKVVDAEPKRIFNKAAKQALQKWKYQPQKAKGKSIMQQGLSVLLSFNMEKER